MDKEIIKFDDTEILSIQNTNFINIKALFQ